MHCRCKEHVSKFNSKSAKIQSESAFVKHLVSKHGGKYQNRRFEEYFKVEILKAFRKPSAGREAGLEGHGSSR